MIMNANSFYKPIFALIVFSFISSCANKTKHNAGDAGEGVVYVCVSNSARRYHVDPDCKGLRRCSYKIIATTVEEAQDNGRTPCRICAY